MKRTRICFTLIELLVVIGIIAVLASMLLPSLTRSRELAKKTYCSNNQKQLGIAMALYRGDFNGFFPPSGDSNATNNVTWDDLLGGYDGRKRLTITQMQSNFGDGGSGGNKVYSCPVDTYSRGNSKKIKRSYSMNGNNQGTPDSLPGEDGGIAQATVISAKDSQIPDPSGVILLGELSDSRNRMGFYKKSIIKVPVASLNSGTANEHLGLHGIYTFNYLFADGHVKSYKCQETATGDYTNEKDCKGMWTLKSGD